ncbi:MAG: ABC transporter permease [Phycisphaeraceae bacterium]
MSSTPLPHAIREMIGGLVHGRYAGYRLARAAIQARYYRSVFGLLWEFAEPIVFALVFTLLHQSRALSAGEFDAPYALFVLAGMMMWKTFIQSLVQSLQSMNKLSNLAGGVRLKPESAILSVLYENAFTLGFRVAILLVVVGWYGMLSPTGLALFFIALPLVPLSGMAIGLLLAPFNLVYRDVGHAVELASWPWMFMSGAVVVLPAEGPMALLRTWNPAAVVVYNLRSLLLFGTLDNVIAFTIVAGATFGTGLAAWYVYHVTFDMAGDMQ